VKEVIYPLCIGFLSLAPIYLPTSIDIFKLYH